MTLIEFYIRFPAEVVKDTLCPIWTGGPHGSVAITPGYKVKALHRLHNNVEPVETCYLPHAVMHVTHLNLIIFPVFTLLKVFRLLSLPTVYVY